MSQRAVECLLGRLLTDRQFRRQFYEEPVERCAHEALDVTPRELDALLALPETHVEELAKRLDPKIIRAQIVEAATPRRSRSTATEKAARASGT